LSSTPLYWPVDVLKPQAAPFNPRPFTRSGGRSLGGINQASRSDRGYWVGSYENIAFRRGTQFDQRRAWEALSTAIGGMSGLVIVPVCATAQWASPGFTNFAPLLTPHDDGAPFDDGAMYYQGVVDIEMAAVAPIGATIVTLRLINAPVVSGVRFSYQHAMYKTGRIISQPTENTYQVEVFPTIRSPIPANAKLEADKPTVLCHLATDAEMDIEFVSGRMPRPSVSFVEAVDYWNAVARGIAA